MISLQHKYVYQCEGTAEIGVQHNPEHTVEMEKKKNQFCVFPVEGIPYYLM